MTVDEIASICKPLRGVTRDIKWENHLCFNVGDKMFLITAPDNSPITASFKASDEDFEELIQREGFIPAPYLARYKWVFVDDIKRLPKKQWEYYAKNAYALIASKLPVKTRKSLGIEVE
jgi:predicted DNA-binding protein (MmcQ/YjbR family)